MNIYRAHIMSWNVERQWLEISNVAPKSLMGKRYPNNHQLNVKIANIITSLANIISSLIEKICM